MEKILKLYTYVDGTNDTPFPSSEEQVIIGSFTYTANRMGSAPSITATVKHRLCLDDLWNDKVYAEFNGEKYFVINTPSSSKSNDDTRYEHDLELLSEREVLNHVYFIDAVQGDSDVDQYKSNSTKVQFYGNLEQFVGRLNASLSYRNLGYSAVIDDGISTEDKNVTFEDKYILEALQEEFNAFEIPYYFVGKEIHFGYTANTITTPFKYGYDSALLSISKDNANYALINRITGTGSSDNIPYYYPNNSPKGDLGIKIISGNMVKSNFIITDYEKFSNSMSLTDVCKCTSVSDGGITSFKWSIGDNDILLSDIGIKLAENAMPQNGASFGQEVLSYITPSQNLMPPIYRETGGAERFYNAKNNTYTDGEGGYYQFENEYSESNPREGITDFEEIKPTIVGVTNSAGHRIDSFIDFAYDTNDNDEVNENGEYLHPYFFAKLRKTDGAYGFNLFDQAIENQAMQISFTSGVCGACTFEIAVGDETQKNLVQVGGSGALMRDEKGNVLCGRKDLQQPQTPQDRQNDTQNYEVWIALRKDSTTYPQVMPNVNYNYKPSTSDTFVILGINLPQAYILKAEDELEKSLIKYMWMNNVEKFTFSAKFSRIFFEENPDILLQLNENSRVLIEYNGRQHTLYIDNYTYKMDSGSPLPEIDVDLVDTLSVGRNSLQTQLDSIKQDILSSMGGSDFLAQGLKYFLRKDKADTAKGKITFTQGLDIGTFVENSGGGTFRILEDGKSYEEVDKLRVRVKAYFETLEIINTNSVGGKMILTAGGGVYLREVVDRETVNGAEQIWDYYRCYFLTQQDGREIENRFKVGDLAMSQSFNIKAGTHQGVTNHYYWREVVGVGDDYIDLSKSICDTGSDAPMAEDTVCHLGNRTDKDRQGAIIFSSVDVFSPSIMLYYGINDFSLVNKEYVAYGIDKTSDTAFFRVYGEMYAGDREQTTYMKYTPEYGVEIRGKLLTQSGKDIENTLNSFQDQIDGVKETFYGEYTPTTSNSPANEWTTEEEKARHEGDVFTNIQEYVDDDTTPDAGKSWRWVKNDETGEWYWLQIADSDTSKAYFEAAKANQAAQDALETVNEMQDTVEGMQNFTDTAFADGIVSRGEASSISAYIKNIETFAKDVSESYLKVYNNTLLEGTDKTNLGNAYTAFNTAKNELVSTINGAISDGKVDSIEKSSVDGKYDAFNTKYGDFVAYLNAANKYIQDVINKNALDALKKIGEFDYLKAALKEYTSIEGGLIQSSTLALGYTSDDGYVVMAGTNGIYDSSKLGGGIASWWGGAMFDRFEYTDGNMPSNVAKGLVRMDGTGYFANGNLWWESDGTLHADPLSFFVGPDSVGDLLSLFQFVKSDDGIEYTIPQYPFQKLEIGNYIQIGKAQLYWDETNKAFYVRHEDGTTPVGFYATGYISAMGANPTSGGTTGGASKLSELSDVSLGTLATNQVLAWDGSKWTNMAMQGSSNLTFTTSGSGNVVTDVSRSGDAVTATKGITAALSNGSNASGTWKINVTGYSSHILSTPISGGSLADKKTGGYLYYSGGNNSVTDKPSGVDAFGLFTMQTASGWQGQILMSSGTVTGLYWRTANNNFNGGWRTVLDSSNYSSIIGNSFVKKSGDTMNGALNIKAPSFPALNITNLGYKGNTGMLGVGNDGDFIIRNNYSGNTDLRFNNSRISWKGYNIWHAGNDGSESGMDADLLDGFQRTYRSSTDNKSYQKLFTLKITGAYTNSPIVFSIKGRSGREAFVALKFNNLNTNDPTISYFQGWGGYSGYYTRLRAYKTATSTWEIWQISQAEGYDLVYVWGIQTTDNVSFTWNGNASTSLPTSTTYTNCTTATIYANVSGNASTSTKLQTARQINGTNFDGSSNITTAKWGNARTLTLGSYLSGRVSIDGSANVTLNANVLGVTSSGNKTAISGTTMPSDGIRLYQVYNNGYPCAYGNLISVKGAGAGELLLEWTGGSSLGHLRYRSKRDNSGNGWSSWGTVAFTTDNVASATNADKLDNVHLNGIFTGFSANGKNTRLVIGGVTKDLTVPYAKNSDTVDSWHGVGTSGNVLKKSGYVTSDKAGLSSYWCKLASFTWGGQYNDQDITLYLHSAFNEKRAIVHLRFRWSSINSTSRKCHILAGNINASDIRLYYSTSSSSENIELWYNTNGQYNFMGAVVLSETNRTSTETGRITLYSTKFTSVQTLPSKSYINAEYITIGNSISGNAASATKLQTARTIWGQSFNGTGNVSGNMTGVGSIDFANASAITLDVFGNVNLTTTSSNSWWVGRSGSYAIYVSHGSMNVGIGTTSVTYRLNVSGVAFATSGIFSNGYVSALGQNSSDARLKTNIRDFKATSLIKQLHPKSFEWNDLAKSKFEVFRNTGMQYGLIAQDVKEVMPEWVDDNLIGSGYMGIRYDKLIPVLLQGEIETISRVETLEDKVRRLEKENYKLKKKVKELERRIE